MAKDGLGGLAKKWLQAKAKELTTADRQTRDAAEYEAQETGRQLKNDSIGEAVMTAVPGLRKLRDRQEEHARAAEDARDQRRRDEMASRPVGRLRVVASGSLAGEWTGDVPALLEVVAPAGVDADDARDAGSTDPYADRPRLTVDLGPLLEAAPTPGAPGMEGWWFEVAGFHGAGTYDLAAIGMARRRRRRRARVHRVGVDVRRGRQPLLLPARHRCVVRHRQRRPATARRDDVDDGRVGQHRRAGHARGPVPDRVAGPRSEAPRPDGRAGAPRGAKIATMSAPTSHDGMRAWWVEHPAPIADEPLRFGRRVVPSPGDDELLVRVEACGVCRTDLHLAEGDLPPRHAAVVPGHEVVGRVVASGRDAEGFAVDDRVGIAWLRSTCGVCRFCRRGDENLCEFATFTGWDHDGGFTEYATVRADFAYRIPDVFDAVTAAPLLCSGIIGFRALRRAALPPGGRLGLYGFGASAHIAAQIALHDGARVHVLTRGVEAQRFALELGCHSAAGAYDAPPEPLDAAILFAPVGDLVPVALRALDRGGTLAIAGIYLTDIPVLDYDRELFQERQLRSVTANTRHDGRELLALAASIPIRPTVTRYDLADADRALGDVAGGRLRGAAVLVVDGSAG